MAKVIDCQLTNVDELPFEFSSGGCNTFSFGVMLCFSAENQQRGSAHQCHSWVMTLTNIKLQNKLSSFDGTTFHTEESSIFPHLITRSLGSYRGSPFVTGGWPGGLETEILNYGTNTWVQGDNYPFSNNGQYVWYAILYCYDLMILKMVVFSQSKLGPT